MLTGDLSDLTVPGLSRHHHLAAAVSLGHVRVLLGPRWRRLAAEDAVGEDRVEVTLTADQWTLVALIDGRRTIRDILELSGAGYLMTTLSVVPAAAVPGTGVGWPSTRSWRSTSTSSD